jgi:DNA-binding MarR family transcriptional regulator
LESIERLERLVRHLREKVNEEFPLQHLAILIKVAQQEGITQHQMVTELNSYSGSMSRNIKLLSQWADRDDKGTLHIKGYNLLECRPDLEERKRMAVYLSPKGKQLMGELDSIMKGEDA